MLSTAQAHNQCLTHKDLDTELKLEISHQALWIQLDL